MAPTELVTAAQEGLAVTVVVRRLYVEDILGDGEENSRGRESENDLATGSAE